MTSDERKYELFRQELGMAQQQVDKYDQLSSNIKAWAITLWTASSGWAIQTQNGSVALIGIVVVFIFWYTDAFNKTFRQDYKRRRVEVEKNLAEFAATGKFPEGAKSPRLPSHEKVGALRNMTLVHVGLPYMVLILLSVIFYLQF